MNRNSEVSRRDLLKATVATTATAVAAPLIRPGVAAADPPPPVMRSREAATVRTVGLPPLPDLAVIALNRMAFGPRPGDLEEFHSLGPTPEAQLQAFVDQQLAPEAIDDSECDSRIAAANLTTLDKTLEQLWADHVVNNNGSGNVRMQPVRETEVATWIRAVYSRRQLVEVLADFWHNHFNVYGWHYYAGPVFVHYDRDVIRGHMLGNFRQMLESVATSTAMLFYLDNYINSRAGPNENYARELMELHTLGAENYLGILDQRDVPGFDEGAPIGYVDGDVYEAARCFTGWRVDYSYWEPGVGQSGTFLYYDAWHDRFQKTVLGKYLPHDQPPMQDGLAVLDAVATHPGTGRHIARKLCRRLIGDDPPQAAVDAAAAVFNAQTDAPDQLAQVVRTVLLSEAFRTSWAEKIKRPLEATAAMLRATAADFTPTDTFSWHFGRAGQGLFQWVPPNGYPDRKENWDGTTSLLERWRLCNRLIEGGVEGTTIDTLSQMPATIRTPNAIADFWIARLLGRAMNAKDRQEIVDFIAQGRNADYDLPTEQINDRLPRMVALILMAPDFQWR